MIIKDQITRASVRSSDRLMDKPMGETLFFAATIISIVWQFCTLVNSLLSSSLISMGVLCLWYVSAVWLLVEKKKLGEAVFIMFPAMIMIFYVGIKFVLSGGSVNTSDFWSPFKPFYLTYTFCHGVIFGFTVFFLPRYRKVQLLNVTLLILAVTPIPSYYYVMKFSDAIRDGVGGWGLISFSYIYAVVPLLGLLMIALKFGKCKGISKWLIAICLVVNTGIIVLANFATAFLMAFLALGIGLVFTRKSTVLKFATAALALIVAVLILRHQIADVIVSVSDMKWFSEVMEKRLLDVADVLNGGSGGSSFGSRLDLMSGAIESFVQYPILGIPYQYINSDTIGFHETWFSLLAYSGVVGLVLTLSTFGLFFRATLMKSASSIFKNGYFMMVIVVVVMSFLNPMIAKSNLMMLLAVMPLFSVMFDKEGAEI